MKAKVVMSIQLEVGDAFLVLYLLQSHHLFLLRLLMDAQTLLTVSCPRWFVIIGSMAKVTKMNLVWLQITTPLINKKSHARHMSFYFAGQMQKAGRLNTLDRLMNSFGRMDWAASCTKMGQLLLLFGPMVLLLGFLRIKQNLNLHRLCLKIHMVLSLVVLQDHRICISILTHKGPMTEQPRFI
jgi:hypothetical protein